MNVRRNSDVIAGLVALAWVPALAADELKPTDETLKALLAAATQSHNAYDWRKADNPLPTPAAVLIPAFFEYADLRKSGTDAVIALDWVSEHASEAQPDPEKAAALVAEATRRLEKMDAGNQTVKESIAYAEYTRGYLLYLGQTPMDFRSHDAVQTIVTDEKRIAAALSAFKKAAAADPEGRSGRRAAEFIPEIERQRPGTKAPDLIGTTADGRPVRVSDYKGKIVVLKFWGGEYGTTGDQFESEREVLRQMKSRGGVVLLGETAGIGAAVTIAEWTDPDATIKAGTQAAQPGGMSTAWSIRGLPQTYVIDGDGVVRLASFSQRTGKLRETVEALLKRP